MLRAMLPLLLLRHLSLSLAITHSVFTQLAAVAVVVAIAIAARQLLLLCRQHMSFVLAAPLLSACLLLSLVRCYSASAFRLWVLSRHYNLSKLQRNLLLSKLKAQQQ